jgi:hypothetical protein
MVKLGAYQIIKGTHVAGISRFNIAIGVLVNGTKFLQKIVHHKESIIAAAIIPFLLAIEVTSLP